MEDFNFENFFNRKVIDFKIWKFQFWNYEIKFEKVSENLEYSKLSK